ncbi:MAG: Saccharopine dehydrogenase [Cirrosporium novae-zelandiae]|nr:MAG: Saccharopine dehydrogenase [Cirrosporium novae-zelandiae]
MVKPVLLLRHEEKPLEHRSALTPTTTKKLIEAGFYVFVERSNMRAFDDSEFEKAGATLLPTGYWMRAPPDWIIIGLKELPEDKFGLSHRMTRKLTFCSKNQDGWQDVLSRFPKGNGTLYDLEFLVDQKGRRVAAFGYHAGYAGAALSIKAWALQQKGKKLGAVEPYKNQDILVSDVKDALKASGKIPGIFIMGALGRCGSGAKDFCQQVGIPESSMIKWDIQETSKRSGPYPEIVSSDIFINCIYLTKKFPPFIDAASLSKNRKLSMIVDVSCDYNSPNNPVPIPNYNTCTDFCDPLLSLPQFQNPPLSVIAIDHLPSLLPRESSEDYSGTLLPTLLTLPDGPVWKRAEETFKRHVSRLPTEKQFRSKL